MSRQPPKRPSNGFALPLILLVFVGLSLWLVTVQYELQKQQRRAAIEQIGLAFLWIAEQAQLYYQRTDEWPGQINELVEPSEFAVDITHLATQFQLIAIDEQLRIDYASSDSLTLATLSAAFTWLEVDSLGAWLTLAPTPIVQTGQLIHLQNEGQPLLTNIDMAGHNTVNIERLHVAELATEQAVVQTTQSTQTTTAQLGIGAMKLSATQWQGSLLVDALSSSSQVTVDQVNSPQVFAQLAQFEGVSVTDVVADTVVITAAQADFSNVVSVQSQRLASEQAVGQQVEVTSLNVDELVADTSHVDSLKVNAAFATDDVLVATTRGLRGLYNQTVQLYDRLYECMYITEACFPAQEPVLMVTCLSCYGLGSMNYYVTTLVISITGCRDTCDLRVEAAPRFENRCESLVEGPQADKSFTCNIRGSVAVGEQLNHPVTVYAMQSGDPRTEVSQTIVLTWTGI